MEYDSLHELAVEVSNKWNDAQSLWKSPSLGARDGAARLGFALAPNAGGTGVPMRAPERIARRGHTNDIQ